MSNIFALLSEEIYVCDKISTTTDRSGTRAQLNSNAECLEGPSNCDVRLWSLEDRDRPLNCHNFFSITSWRIVQVVLVLVLDPDLVHVNGEPKLAY